MSFLPSLLLSSTRYFEKYVTFSNYLSFSDFKILISRLDKGLALYYKIRLGESGTCKGVDQSQRPLWDWAKARDLCGSRPRPGTSMEIGLSQQHRPKQA